MRRHRLSLPRAPHACRLLAAALFLAAGVLSAQAQSPTAVAAPPATLDSILKDVSTYNGGIESSALWKLRDYVRAHKDDSAARVECEAKLLAFLRTSATPVAKMAASRHLRVIAGDTAIPALLALLADERTADMALYVLQPLPGPAADKALLTALARPKLAPAVRIAVIAALGERRSGEAVPALASLLQQPPMAKAVVTALGAIGTNQASQALTAAYDGAAAELKPTIAASLLKCAERAVAAGDRTAAAPVYERLAADTGLPSSVRKAAALGRMVTTGSGATRVLMTYLEGSDVVLQEAAIDRLRDDVSPGAAGAVCELLPRLPEASQVKLIAALALYPKARVLAPILDQARSDSAAVRLAAFKALESVGDETVVPFLAAAAAKARGTEQTAVRSALALLKGRPVDEALLKLLAQGPDEDVHAELLLAVAERRMFPARTLVAASLASPSQKVRAGAMRALRTLGTPSDMAAVLDLLLGTENETERGDAEAAVLALAQKTSSSVGRADVVRSRLTAEKDPGSRARLITVMGMIGDNSTLPALRSALEDTDAGVYDAAVRALAAWPNSGAREDVQPLARDCRNETHRLLAIRGLIRIIGLDRYRDPRNAVADLRQAAGYAWRPEEQRLVLAAVVRFPSEEALSLATGFLRDPTVKEEAQAAVDKIKERLAELKKTT